MVQGCIRPFLLCRKHPVSHLFYKTLLKRGYLPLKVKDIDSLFAIKKGDDLFTIGFPQNSWIAGKRLPLTLWESSIVSVPMVSKGIYAHEYPKKSNSFDAMIFVTHGFSGGPVIRGNKIIGIVSSGQLTEPFTTGDKTPFKYVFSNHSKFIKSPVVLQVLRRLESQLDVILNKFPKEFEGDK